jgi:mono/diheme cytochrome c family protein
LPQTKEYARLAIAMGKNEPPKGTKDSWTKLSTAFANSATALDKAAQAKNKDAALEALGQLQGSCMECHMAHRQMGRGPGGPPRGGFPKGAPPPPPKGGADKQG